MTKWEYHYGFIPADDFTFPSKKARHELDNEGDSGWELVSVVPHTDFYADIQREREPIQGFLCVYKRPR